jgi:hypothetical protein
MQCDGVELDSADSEQRPVAGCYGHDDVNLGSVCSVEYRDIGVWQISSMDCATETEKITVYTQLSLQGCTVSQVYRLVKCEHTLTF